MKTDQQRACPQRIPVATLSAWRDGDLSHVKAEHLRAHITDCAACQETIAAYTTLGRTLQRGLAEGHHEANRRQDRLWRALRARILWQSGGQWMKNTQTRIWRGVGVAVTVLLLAGLALQLWRNHTSSVAQTPHATATQQQTPAPLDPAIANLPTLTQAWGARAITYSMPIGADSSGDPAFRPGDIAPDGSVVAGFAYSNNQVVPSVIEMLTVATGKMQHLADVTYSTSGFIAVFSTSIVKTDGNYVAWLNQAAAGWQIILYDVHHGTQVTLQTAQSTGEIFMLVGLDHGQLFWIDQHNGVHKSYVLNETDLTTHATTTIVPQANYAYFNATVSWPYVFYSELGSEAIAAAPGASPVNTSFLYNLTTGKQISLSFGQANNSYVSAGATLYRQVNNTTGSAQRLEIDALQHADQPGATWQKLLTTPWSDDNSTSLTTLAMANSRLLLFNREYASSPANLIAWDSKQQRLILVEPALNVLGQTDTLHGDWLAYLSGNTAKTYTLHVINTTQLP